MRTLPRLWLLAVLAAPLLARAQADPWASENRGPTSYATGFEDFTPGSIADQQGWVGINGRFTISTANPGEGAQHFRGTSSGLAWSFARSPFISGTDPFTVASAGIDLGTSTPAAIWEFTPGIANLGGITTVRFNADRSIDVLVASPIPEGVFVPTGASAPTGYFDLAVEVERSTGHFRVLLDGTLIAQEQGLLAGGIEAVIVYSDMEDGTAGHTFDMDGIAIFNGTLSAVEPGPGGGMLSAAYPTPFIDRARLDLRVSASQHVTAALYDMLGRRVAVLFHGTLGAGETRPLSVEGAGLAPGLYVVRVAGETFAASRRVVRAR